MKKSINSIISLLNKILDRKRFGIIAIQLCYIDRETKEEIMSIDKDKQNKLYYFPIGKNLIFNLNKI